MTQYAVLIYASDSAHAVDAAPKDIADCDQHADELTDTNAMTAAWALTPRELAVSVRATGITAGPFIADREIVAGFYLLEAPDMETAVALARTNPVVLDGGGVEVRPVHSGGLVQR